MKPIALLLAILVTMAPLLYGQSKLDFRLSRDAALKLHLHPAEVHVMEFGDATGPFHSVGGVEVNAAGLPRFATSMGDVLSSVSPGQGDSNVVLHVEFFVNEKGHGYGVVRQRPVENTVPSGKEKLPEDHRPHEHVVLCEAASWAIAGGNTRLLEALIHAGLLLNEPLDWESGWIALHYAALHNQPRVVKMLLEHGADLEVKTRHGERPIDVAMEKEGGEVCELLRKPSEKERLIGGYPEKLIEVVFPSADSPLDQEVKFLSLNGLDPPDDLLKHFRQKWPNVRPRSHVEEVGAGESPSTALKTSYRDARTKDHGVIVELVLVEEGEGIYDWSCRRASGPALAGGGVKGKASKKYGYWMKTGSVGWDE